MAENVIAIILPEYDDGGNAMTSDDWKRNLLLDDVGMGECIKELAGFVDFFSDENCRMIYDSKNILAFAYVLRTMPEYYPSRESQLRLALKKAFNWRANRESGENDVYSMEYITLKDETRCELAVIKTKDSRNSCLLVAHIPEFKSQVWRLSKDGKESEIHSCQLDVLEVFNWISGHHKPVRRYNWNPKHGENGCGAHKKHAGEDISVLLCSKEHAAELLPKAIGLPAWDSLYNYDAMHGKYMAYKAECKFEHLQSAALERAYHSYHLESEELVPKRIVEKMKRLGYVP